MAIDMDMEEIHSIFYEESMEGLEVMEAGLLQLTPGTTEKETVNDIFRAAHSIKGGAATFGFSDIASFTHGVETLLDQIRSAERAVTEALVEALLASVDCIRGMIIALQNGETFDINSSNDVQQVIDGLLNTKNQTEPEEAENNLEVSDSMESFKIRFEPNSEILGTGNEPARIFRELASMGEFSSNLDYRKLPDFSTISPEKCYLAWDITLRTEAGTKSVEAAFDWVSDQANLTIETESLATGKPTSALTPAPKPEDEASIPINASQSSAKESGSIRVSIDKIDTLLNLVGELVITQSMLARFADTEHGNRSDKEGQGLRDGLLILERHTRELQESAMQIRMLPIGASFSRFKRLVRDLSAKTGKKVELKLSGENTELDKTVLEKMSDPLVHLVRNSLDHGIEKPSDRIAAGKAETGTLHLSAYHEGGNIVIQIEDDGAGLNKDKILAKAVERGLIGPGEQLSEDQIHHLIFQPGFSTAEAVSDLSGRGVGMDVVRRNINDLGGRVEVSSKPGLGSTFKIRLPLTLAILDGQLVRVGSDVYIFSLLSIVETVLVSPREINKVVGRGNVYRLRDDYIPVVRLRDVFNLQSSEAIQTYLEREGELLVVVESDGERIGLFVDELLEQQQVVIKSLEENYKPVDGLAGATILGDGNVALIIDVPGLVKSLDLGRNKLTKNTYAA